MPYPANAFNSAAAKAAALPSNVHSFLEEHGSNYGAPTSAILSKMLSSRKGAAWNLPPHKWSVLRSVNPKGDRAERRGKIYYLDVGTEQRYATKYDPETYKPIATPINKKVDQRKYGFRFLWNPDTYSSQTALILEATPSSSDAFVGGQGLFPGMASISFTIRLDRTNDFACFKAKYPDGNVPAAAFGDLFTKYYAQPEGLLKDEDKSTNDRVVPGASKLKWLLQMGTLADIEYIYRAINDISVSSKVTGPQRDLKSADIGFLAFSMLAFELGPQYYNGYITGLSINHITFTEEYIPIVSDVTINANVMAYSTVTSASTGG